MRLASFGAADFAGSRGSTAWPAVGLATAGGGGDAGEADEAGEAGDTDGTAGSGAAGVADAPSARRVESDASPAAALGRSDSASARFVAGVPNDRCGFEPPAAADLDVDVGAGSGAGADGNSDGDVDAGAGDAFSASAGTRGA